MSSTNDTGTIGEHLTVIDLLKTGCRVYKEVTNGHDVDLVVETSQGFKKVQVKSCADTSKGAISVDRERRFKDKHGVWRRVTYDGSQVDIIALVAVDRAQILYVPVKDFGEHITMCIRLEPSKNGQRKGIKLACDFTFEKAISA